MNKELIQNLQNWAAEYETAQFIESDPIQIPHRYNHPLDIEVSAFVTSWLSSSCKRLNMFLRWMIRRGPVDFGLWNVDPINLIIPLDTHVIKSELRLGLIKRRTPDMQTALQLTNTLKEVFPNDPVKGDFALLGSDIKRK